MNYRGLIVIYNNFNNAHYIATLYQISHLASVCCLSVMEVNVWFPVLTCIWDYKPSLGYKCMPDGHPYIWTSSHNITFKSTMCAYTLIPTWGRTSFSLSPDLDQSNWSYLVMCFCYSLQYCTGMVTRVILCVYQWKHKKDKDTYDGYLQKWKPFVTKG